MFLKHQWGKLDTLKLKKGRKFEGYFYKNKEKDLQTKAGQKRTDGRSEGIELLYIKKS